MPSQLQPDENGKVPIRCGACNHPIRHASGDHDPYPPLNCGCSHNYEPDVDDGIDGYRLDDSDPGPNETRPVMTCGRCNVPLTSNPELDTQVATDGGTDSDSITEAPLSLTCECPPDDITGHVVLDTTEFIKRAKDL